MIEFLFLALIGAVIWFCAKLIQLGKFSDEMHRAFDTMWSSEKYWSPDLRIDVGASYDNLDRSWPWNYNFKKMIVYTSIID